MTSAEAAARTDAGTLERELRNLWKEISEKSQEGGEQAVTRACVHNLIVFAPGEGSESELSRLLADLMIDQPGRVFLILTDPSVDRNHLSGWVNAQCHRTSGQRQQVCSEQIILRAGEDEIDNLPSLIIPLLVPDLPIFFWWRDDLNDRWRAFGEIIENADRVIVDSSRFAQPRDSLRKLIAIVKAERGITSFSDLNWGRLTPWRQMIAEIVDHAACRSVLQCVNTVDIQAYNASGTSTQALLLAAWLGSRLKWTPVSGDSVSLVMDSGGRKVRTRVFVRPPALESQRGIATVTVHAENPDLTFHMALEADTRYLRGSVEKAGDRPAESTMRVPHVAGDEQLGIELEILGRDRIYEETLSLLESFL